MFLNNLKTICFENYCSCLLQSLWGKFAQRDNLKQSQYFRDPAPFMKFITDPAKNITDFYIINDTTAQLQWKHTEEFKPDSCMTNIFVAIFTTAWARLKLYEVIDMLQERCLYYDTDSCIYVSRPGMPDPPISDHLGDLTSELPPGTYIEEFVSGGPKNYAYRLTDGTEVCKVRGFNINFQNSKLINFDAIKDIVCTGIESITIVNDHKITRNVRKRKIENKREEKKYRKVYTKRVLLPDLNTVPYGY